MALQGAIDFYLMTSPASTIICCPVMELFLAVETKASAQSSRYVCIDQLCYRLRAENLLHASRLTYP